MSATPRFDARGGWVGALSGYLAVYAALLAALYFRHDYAIVEPLFVLIVFGGGFTLLAWWSTRRVTPRATAVAHPGREARLLILYLLPLAGFITWGLPAVRAAVPDPHAAQTVAEIGAKLVAFVGLPFLLLRAVGGCRLRDVVDLRAGFRGHWLPFLVLALALVAFQLIFGRALRDLDAVGPAPAELAVAIPVALLLATVEAGLCEEFFFRALLLERLQAWWRAPGPALFASAAIFGLAHAPGLYLRPQVTGEALTDPSLLLAVGYSIVILSVPGLVFGLLWLRTRNLPLLALLHGVNDLVPAVAPTAEWLRGG